MSQYIYLTQSYIMIWQHQIYYCHYHLAKYKSFGSICVFLDDCVGIRFWYLHYDEECFWFFLLLLIHPGSCQLEIEDHWPSQYISFRIFNDLERCFIWKSIFKGPTMCSDFFFISKSTFKGQTMNVTRLLSILDLTWHFRGFEDFQSNNQQESLQVFNQTRPSEMEVSP